MNRETLKALVDGFGKRYSEALGINLEDEEDGEIFKWFLASLLFAAPIAESSAIKTYMCFQEREVLTPWKILETGWDGLVKILDKGGYTRYDFKTADKLIAVTRNLIEKYDGRLSLVHQSASSAEDLENRLKNLGKGVGRVTVSIFLRDLRDKWQKAKPDPTSHVVLAAKNLAIVRNETLETVYEQLERFWIKNEVTGESFVNFETSLLRLGKNFCRKKKCAYCPVKIACTSSHAGNY